MWQEKKNRMAAKIDIIRSKILSGKTLDRALSYWRFRGCRIVFTNGCFDIIHLGHAEYLAKAAEKADVLVVGLNTDRSVRALKGSSRPLQDERSRSFILASFSFVSAVVLFDEETPLRLISHVRPDILVKGSDYSPRHIVGHDIVRSWGGKVETIDLVEGYSTSSILGSIARQRDSEGGSPRS